MKGPTYEDDGKPNGRPVQLQENERSRSISHQFVKSTLGLLEVVEMLGCAQHDVLIVPTLPKRPAMPIDLAARSLRKPRVSGCQLVDVLPGCTSRLTTVSVELEHRLYNPASTRHID
jgi:hypothetical protein